jgi:hypothetical protein
MASTPRLVVVAESELDSVVRGLAAARMQLGRLGHDACGAGRPAR